jgi:hypothetical protein
MEEWKYGRMEVNFLHPQNVNPACRQAGVLRQLHNSNRQQSFISSNWTLGIYGMFQINYIEEKIFADIVDKI